MQRCRVAATQVDVRHSNPDRLWSEVSGATVKQIWNGAVCA